MSKFIKAIGDTVLGVFTPLLSEFTKPKSWPKNFLPLGDRTRIARYEILDSMTNNYLGDLMRSKGLATLKRDDKGRTVEAYEGYGEGKKICSLISNAILGDEVKLVTDQEALTKAWFDHGLMLAIQDGEDRGAELGDLVYNIRFKQDKEGKLKPIIEWIDPAGLFVVSEENGVIQECYIAFFPATGQYKEYLYVLHYKIIEGLVYYEESYNEVLEDNKEDVILDKLKIFKDLTVDISLDGLTETSLRLSEKENLAIVGLPSKQLDEIPVIHIPFLSVAGEYWGQSALNSVVNVIYNIFSTNADIQEGALLAAVPMLCKEKDQWNREGVEVYNPVTDTWESPEIKSGVIFDGKMSVLDNSNVLKAATDHRDALVKIGHENMNIPSLVYSQDKVIGSGVALDISLYPFRTFVTKVRNKRKVQYDKLFRVILKVLGEWGNEDQLSETHLVFGVFANLGSQLMTSVSQLVLAMVLSPSEGKAILEKAGLIDQEIIDLNLGDQNNDPTNRDGNNGSKDTRGNGSDGKKGTGGSASGENFSLND